MKKTLIRNIKDSDLLRHNLVFFVGSLCIAVFNYLYYPVISRMVPVSDFGEIQAVISIFMQLGILLTAFGYVVTNIINNEKSRESSKVLIIYLEKITLVIACAILLILCLGSYLLKGSLQFSSAVPFALIGILVVINVPSTSRTYLLQGVKRLKEVSLSGIIFAISKLIFSIIMIIMGLSVIAVVSAYILAQLLTLLYLIYQTRKDFPGIRESRAFVKSNELSISQKKIIKKEIIYGLAIIVLLFSITLLYSFDVVVARLFLSAEDAGFYSGISAIARIVYFITASVSGVLIATVKIQDGYIKSRKLLLKSGLIIILIGGCVSLFFTLFSNFSVKILLGASYVGHGYLLPVMSLVMLICSLNNLLICFQIARRQYKAIICALLGLLTLIVLLYLRHDCFNDIIFSYLISNIVTFGLLSIQVTKKGSENE